MFILKNILSLKSAEPEKQYSDKKKQSVRGVWVFYKKIADNLIVWIEKFH